MIPAYSTYAIYPPNSGEVYWDSNWNLMGFSSESARLAYNAQIIEKLLDYKYGSFLTWSKWPASNTSKPASTAPSAPPYTPLLLPTTTSLSTRATDPTQVTSGGTSNVALTHTRDGLTTIYHFDEQGSAQAYVASGQTVSNISSAEEPLAGLLGVFGSSGYRSTNGTFSVTYDYPRVVFLKGAFVPPVNLALGKDNTLRNSKVLDITLSMWQSRIETLIYSNVYGSNVLPGVIESWSGLPNGTVSSSVPFGTLDKWETESLRYYYLVCVDSDGFVGLTPYFTDLWGDDNFPHGVGVTTRAVCRVTKTERSDSKAKEKLIFDALGLTFTHPTLRVAFGANFATVPTTYTEAASAFSASPSFVNWSKGDDIVFYVGFFCEEDPTYPTKYSLSRLIYNFNGTLIEGGVAAGSMQSTLSKGQFKVFKYVIPNALAYKFMIDRTPEQQTARPDGFVFLNTTYTNDFFTDTTYTRATQSDKYPEMYNIIFKDAADNWVLEWKEGNKNYPAMQEPLLGNILVLWNESQNPFSYKWKTPHPDGTKATLTTGLSFGSTKVSNAPITKTIVLQINDASNGSISGYSLKFTKPNIAITLTGYSTIPARIASDFTVTASVGGFTTLSAATGTAVAPVLVRALPSATPELYNTYEVTLTITFKPTSYISNYLVRNLTINLTDVANNVVNAAFINVSGVVTG